MVETNGAGVGARGRKKFDVCTGASRRKRGHGFSRLGVARDARRVADASAMGIVPMLGVATAARERVARRFFATVEHASRDRVASDPVAVAIEASAVHDGGPRRTGESAETFERNG